LYCGLASLIETWARVSDRPNVKAVQYEQLVNDPVAHWPPVFDLFGVNFEEKFLSDLPQLQGRLGDKTGAQRYRHSQPIPENSWMPELCRPLRRRWARRYVEWIGESRLESMGYKYSTTLERIGTRPSYPLAPTDILFLGLEDLYHFIEPALVRSKFSQRSGKRDAGAARR
jgi:hypothetical protein